MVADYNRMTEWRKLYYDNETLSYETWANFV